MKPHWLALAAGIALGAEAGVDVFVARGMAVENGGAARIHVLDDPRRLAAAAGFALPGNPSLAEAAVGRRLASDLGGRFAAAARAHARASELGVERVPAVVVDGSHVVYGTLDVVRALRLVAAHRGSVPGAGTAGSRAARAPVPGRAPLTRTGGPDAGDGSGTGAQPGADFRGSGAARAGERNTPARSLPRGERKGRVREAESRRVPSQGARE